jgi:cell wall-associated NlpC family hydrolase
MPSTRKLPARRPPHYETAPALKRLLVLCVLVAGCAASPVAGAGPAAYALEAVGSRYRYGGSSPETGFDCSGLVVHVFRQAWGLALPRTVRAQSKLGRPVRFAELKPGDLVFYNTRHRRDSHVGIYVGDRRFVHAPKPGGRVRLESVDASYWRARFDGARRLNDPDAPR